MTDFNKKFKDLNNKITQITEESKYQNQIVNQYINKLDDIEYKTQKKISSLDNYLTNLKENYTKLSNLFETTNSNKNNSSNNIINKINNHIETDLKLSKNDKLNYINSIFGKLEVSLNHIKEKRIKERKNLEKEIDDLKTFSEDIINKKIKEIEKRKENTKNIIEEVKNNCLNEFNNVNLKIKDEENKRNNNIYDFKIHLKEVEERINKEFDSQTKKREKFKENIYSVIEETCNKILES